MDFPRNIPAILIAVLALSCLSGCGRVPEAEKEKVAEQTKGAISEGKVKKFLRSDYNHLLAEKARTEGSLPPNLFLAVTGKVESKTITRREDFTDIRIVLKPWPDSGVEAVCTFPASHEPYVNSTKVGETISVAGKLWSLGADDFDLVGCVPGDGS